MQYQLLVPRNVALGGKIQSITKGCTLLAKVEGLPVEVDAYILNEIGVDEDNGHIEILFGVLAMQKWVLDRYLMKKNSTYHVTQKNL